MSVSTARRYGIETATEAETKKIAVRKLSLFGGTISRTYPVKAIAAAIGKPKEIGKELMKTSLLSRESIFLFTRSTVFSEGTPIPIPL